VSYARPFWSDCTAPRAHGTCCARIGARRVANSSFRLRVSIGDAAVSFAGSTLPEISRASSRSRATRDRSIHLRTGTGPSRHYLRPASQAIVAPRYRRGHVGWVINSIPPHLRIRCPRGSSQATVEMRAWRPVGGSTSRACLWARAPHTSRCETSPWCPWPCRVHDRSVRSQVNGHARCGNGRNLPNPAGPTESHPKTHGISTTPPALAVNPLPLSIGLRTTDRIVNLNVNGLRSTSPQVSAQRLPQIHALATMELREAVPSPIGDPTLHNARPARAQACYRTPHISATMQASAIDCRSVAKLSSHLHHDRGRTDCSDTHGALRRQAMKPTGRYSSAAPPPTIVRIPSFHGKGCAWLDRTCRTLHLSRLTKPA